MTLDSPVAEGIALVLALALIAGISLLFTWAILRAGDKPPLISLIVSLSLLSLIALAIGAATSSETALTIAATGVGALAASVTAAFGETKRQFDVRHAAAIEEARPVQSEEAPDEKETP